MGDFAIIRDYGKRVGVKVVGKKEEEAKRLVMEAILARVEEAKANKDIEWVKENKDMIDWYNAQEEVNATAGAGGEASGETASDEKDKGGKKEPKKPAAKAPTALDKAREKAAAAKAKAAEGKSAKKAKGGRGGGGKVDRAAQLSNKDFKNASQHLTYLFGQGTTEDAAVKALMKKWPGLARCSTKEQASSLFKIHIKTLTDFGLTVKEKDGVYKATA